MMIMTFKIKRKRGKQKMDSLKVEFNTVYVSVFDSEGKVKACGRDKCKALMEISNKIEPDTVFGDKNTGYLNVANVKALYDKLNKA